MLENRDLQFYDIIPALKDWAFPLWLIKTHQVGKTDRDVSLPLSPEWAWLRLRPREARVAFKGTYISPHNVAKHLLGLVESFKPGVKLPGLNPPPDWFIHQTSQGEGSDQRQYFWFERLNQP